jgi:hypothetical protein
MKKLLLALLLFGFPLMTLTSAPAWSEDKGHKCKMCEMKSKEGHGCKMCPMKAQGGHGERLEDKFFMKAHFYLDKKDELGLSEEQVNRIKNLKVNLKKELIKNEAEVDIVAVDIKARLMDDKINAGDINALIDKKYEFKKTAAKATVTSFAELKTVLNDDQKEKAKGIWEAKSKSGKCPMCAAKGGHGKDEKKHDKKR